MSGDENNENGVNELMEHRLRSHAITLRFTFSFGSFMVLISSRASLDLSCDFIIRLLHDTQSSKSKICLQQRQRYVNYLHRSAAALVATLPQKKRRCRFSLLTEKNSGASATAAKKTAALVAALFNSAAVPTSEYVSSLLIKTKPTQTAKIC